MLLESLGRACCSSTSSSRISPFYHASRLAAKPFAPLPTSSRRAPHGSCFCTLPRLLARLVCTEAATTVMAPWLQALSSHSILTLPTEPSSSAPSSPPAAFSQLPLPASPGLSSIFPSSPSSSNRPNSALASSSRHLFPPSTPVKHASSSLSSSTARRAHAPEVPPKDEAVRKHKSVLVRGTDLVVAVGKELRIASLGDVKARCSEEGEGSLEEEVALGDYKVRLPSVLLHRGCWTLADLRRRADSHDHPFNSLRNHPTRPQSYLETARRNRPTLHPRPRPPTQGLVLERRAFDRVPVSSSAVTLSPSIADP